jgi:glutathione S-transferase
MDLYHNNMSTCSQKVRLVLREKNLKPVEHHLNLRAGDQTRPDYLKLNPKGVVPTIVDHDQPIVESTIISEYLDDAYPERPLRPHDPIKRAAMRNWTSIPDTGLHSACGVVSFAIAFRHQYLALPKEDMERQLAEKPDPVARASQSELIRSGVEARFFPDAMKAYDRALTAMARQLDRTPWLAGDEYSLAETALLPYIRRLEDLSLSWLWEGRRGSIAKWLDGCKSRANYSAIADYLDPKYLELMARVGEEARGKIKSILGN